MGLRVLSSSGLAGFVNRLGEGFRVLVFEDGGQAVGNSSFLLQTFDGHTASFVVKGGKLGPWSV